MPLWKIEVFADKLDSTLLRRGYVNANTELDAVNIATKSMGDNQRADLVRVTETVSLPVGEVIWVSKNA